MLQRSSTEHRSELPRAQARHWEFAAVHRTDVDNLRLEAGNTGVSVTNQPS